VDDSVRGKDHIHKERGIHGGLEQLVQIVHSLYQLKRDADQKELLQLVDDITADADPNRNRRDQATRSNDDIEDVPAVGAEASPAQTVETHEDVDDVYDSYEQKEIICVARDRSAKRSKVVT
jgi:hypothetical protein